jgi:hypothetical protein
MTITMHYMKKIPEFLIIVTFHGQKMKLRQAVKVATSN